MAETTGIEWTDATWNPWYGCQRVSPGCDFCYADRDMRRFGRDFATVTQAAPATFNAPLRWKESQRIFTCSWSDFFIRQADSWREAAWSVMERTPQHQYQILTKRPGRMLAWAKEKGWLPNVWAGTSVESQKYAPRLDLLAQVPAPVRFVSVEPMLGPVNLTPWMPMCECGHYWDYHYFEGSETPPGICGLSGHGMYQCSGYKARGGLRAQR